MMNKLESGLEQLGIQPSPKQFAQLESYISELELWNRKLNLVSCHNREQLVVRHILDCLAGLPVFKSAGSTFEIADVGSGAGLPGILLAIFLEESRVTLIERSGKKAGFLRSAAAVLGIIDRVSVAESDLRGFNGCFDIVTCRAFRDFADFAEDLLSITSGSGFIAAYKGRLISIEQDLAAAGIAPESVTVKKIDVPFLDEERHILIIPN